ncbi:MAG TPA: AMIN domain-containing protein, partial [Nevskiaceae bacterium]|nr:AMIN domain-containing protein [Nevskiaceae bacterium]
MRPLFFMLMLLLTLPAQAAELKDMRLWEGPDSTRVVFDLSATASHNIFTLENPSRLVVDISGIDAQGARIARRLDPLGVVQKVRSAPRPDGALRVVLDLSGPVAPKSFILEPGADYGYRLVIDLYQPKPAADAPAADAAVAAVTTPPADAVPAEPALAAASAPAPPTAPAVVSTVPDPAPAPAPVPMAAPVVAAVVAAAP